MHFPGIYGQTIKCMGEIWSKWYHFNIFWHFSFLSFFLGRNIFSLIFHLLLCFSFTLQATLYLDIYCNLFPLYQGMAGTTTVVSSYICNKSLYLFLYYIFYVY